MNFRYFACRDCKIYIDAGYRWALEIENPGVVVRGETVDGETVLAASNYWNPPCEEASRWLVEEVFPPLRRFFDEHKSHQIVYGEEDDIAPPGFDPDWMQVGYLLQPTPRYLVEVLGFTSWEQVSAYMERQEVPPAWWECTWWGDPSPHEQGRRKFEELLKSKRV